MIRGSRVLVTGASGKVALPIARALAAAGNTVYGVARFASRQWQVPATIIRIFSTYGTGSSAGPGCTGAGMGPENVEEFSLTLQGEAALSPWLENTAAHLGAVSADDIAASLGGLVSDVDKAALTGEFAEYMARSFRRAISRGVAGWRDDDLAFARPWGFGLASITTPVSVWQGGQDRMVPYAHGVWLAEHVAGARAHLHPEHGHLSLGVDAIGSVMDDLVALAGSQEDVTAPGPGRLCE